VVVVGRTGSGKTILCNLVARILEPPQGYLFFDGIEIHEIPLDVLRRSIGYVPQDTFLFSESIARTSLLGSETPQTKRLKRQHDLLRSTMRL